MRKISYVFAAAMLVLSILAPAAQELRIGGKDYGPIVDKVIFDVRMDQSIGLKDTAEGKTDIFANQMNARTYLNLPQADKDKLMVFSVPSGTWSLLTNPIPNKAPYVWTTAAGEEYFNPLAIREVRYALNWLIDRKKLVDEILAGYGEPMFTPMTPGQPGTYRYNLIATKLGLSPRGDEKRALADIEKAMQAAAALPENQGKLKKGAKYWEYKGKPVVIKFIIRVDDPNGRLPAGRYIADQLEKAGFQVERLEWDRSKASRVVYGDDPAKYDWTLYTEGWGAGATRAWWDVVISQMYAPYYGYMPGGATEGFWNYQQDEIDRLGQKGLNGWFLTEKEYWDDNLKALELGIKEAVRIYLASQEAFYAANKARMNGYFAYGLGDGLNEWSFITADVKPNANGEKVLRATQFSARGGLFMSAWDPIGVDGFSDLYSSYMIGPVTMNATFEAPNSALDTPYLVTWNIKDIQTKVGPGKTANDKPVGLIDVPETAIKYNSTTKKWEPVGKGVKAYSKGTYKMVDALWHNGRKIGLEDIMFASAFSTDWATKDGDNDARYEEAFASQYQPGIESFKGLVINKDGTITTYFDFNWPMDLNRVAATGAPSPKAGNPGRSTLVSWEIYEALALLVSEGAKSGTKYSITQDPALTEVDVISPKCVADIRAKLEEMIERKYVPVYIKDYVSVNRAVDTYKKAIEFIDKYKHAYISSGPFFISKVDTTANSVELTAFRTFPYKKDYFVKLFASAITNIENVNVPAMVQKTADVNVNVTVSTYVYPDPKTSPATDAVKVKATLITPAGEKVYTGKFDKAGAFTVTIPKADLANLAAGSYTLVVESNLKDEAPSVKSATLVVF